MNSDFQSEELCGLSAFNLEVVRDMYAKWPEFKGFSGETCRQCSLQANVPVDIETWLCTCGTSNAVSEHNVRLAHTDPQVGPPLRMMRLGLTLAFRQRPAAQRREQR
jgi:hypothetical protein